MNQFIALLLVLWSFVTLFCIAEGIRALGKKRRKERMEYQEMRWRCGR